MGAWVGAALTGLGALGGLFGTKKQTSDTTSNSTAMPTYDPKNQAFRDFLIDAFTKRASGDGEKQFQDAYTTGGLKNLNFTNSLANSGIDDLLTSRGLSRTTAGVGTLRDTTLSNAGKTSNFLNSIPLIMDQRNMSNLAAAGGYQASLPVGQTTNSSSHTVGTVAPSSPLAGVIGGGTSTLAGYLGQWSANKQFGDVLKNLKVGG